VPSNDNEVVYGSRTWQDLQSCGDSIYNRRFSRAHLHANTNIWGKPGSHMSNFEPGINSWQFSCYNCSGHVSCAKHGWMPWQKHGKVTAPEVAVHGIATNVEHDSGAWETIGRHRVCRCPTWEHIIDSQLLTTPTSTKTLIPVIAVGHLKKLNKNYALVTLVCAKAVGMEKKPRTICDEAKDITFFFKKVSCISKSILTWRNPSTDLNKSWLMHPGLSAWNAHPISYAISQEFEMGCLFTLPKSNWS